jgi:hypothetical protein
MTPPYGTTVDELDGLRPRSTCRRSFAISKGDVRKDDRAPAEALDKMVQGSGSVAEPVRSSDQALNRS